METIRREQKVKGYRNDPIYQLAQDSNNTFGVGKMQHYHIGNGLLYATTCGGKECLYIPKGHGIYRETLGEVYQQKKDLRPADAIRVRMGCVRPMRPVRPDRLADVFSHPMRLVPPNALISPPMHPARLLQPPSVPTPPSSLPLLPLSSDGIRRTHSQFPAPGPPAPYLLPPAT